MQRSKLFLFLVFSGILLSLVFIDHVRAIESVDTESLTNTSSSRKMQLVLLLDTSSSMDGLIEQAKSQLWSTLVALSQTTKDGDPPVLEMSLYEYGNSRLNAREGYVKQVIGFTSDMDAVSGSLFELSTGGGDEYCGEVIAQSLTELKWDQNPGAAKIIFIAGNEGFDQGNTPFSSACSQAVETGVVVNTIFCGPCQTGVQLHWKEGADLTGGHYSCIDQNQTTVYVATPYDDELAALDTRLNETYLAYGTAGAARQRLQQEQDSNARIYGKSNSINRAAFKVSANYSNSSWDLVDAYAADSTVVNRSGVLPATLAGKSTEEVKRQVKELTSRRKKIQDEIRRLSAQRNMYIQREKTKRQAGNVDLEGAMLNAIYEQAARKNFVRPGLGLLNSSDPATGMIIPESKATAYPSAKVSLTDFAVLIAEVAKDRDNRLLSLDDFLVEAQKPKTVVLDARSREMYMNRHLGGAINLPYTEFTSESLARLIPDPNTRILIYCNNNFDGDPDYFMGKGLEPVLAQLRGVEPRLLALNIPTHVTLRGYGYQNVYELDEMVVISDLRLQGMWEGISTEAFRSTQVRALSGR